MEEKPQDVRFEDIGKLQHPNLDWDATLALKETREALRLCFAGNEAAKMHFIGAVEALMDSTVHYWFLDSKFEQDILVIEQDFRQRLLQVPEGMDANPETGISRIGLGVNAARKKYRRIMIAITKVSKDVPYVDEA